MPKLQAVWLVAGHGVLRVRLRSPVIVPVGAANSHVEVAGNGAQGRQVVGGGPLIEAPGSTGNDGGNVDDEVPNWV